MNLPRIILQAVGLILVGASVVATADDPALSPLRQECERLFQTIQDNARFPDLKRKITYFREHGTSCAGTGIYESRLATFYKFDGQYAAAEKVLERGLATANPYHRELRLGVADLAIFEGDLARAEKEASMLVEDFPEWFGGYRLLAQINLVRKNYEASIDFALKANQREPESGVYLGLAIAYYQLKQDREAVDAAYEAIELDDTVVGKRLGIDEAIYSLVQLGRYEEAERLITARTHADPHWRDDAALVKAIEFLKHRPER